MMIGCYVNGRFHAAISRGCFASYNLRISRAHSCCPSGASAMAADGVVHLSGAFKGTGDFDRNPAAQTLLNSGQ